MSRTAQVSITTRDEQFPTGTVFAGFRFRATREGGASAQQVVSVTTVQFAGLPAGLYTFEVAGIDSAGEVLGTPASMTLDVVDATVTIAVPDTLAVQLL